MFKNPFHRQHRWTWECNIIVQLIQEAGFIATTNHCRQRMEQRSITQAEIEEIYYNNSAEIIQGHAKQTYAVEGGKLNKDELRVFYGKTNAGRVLHVVVAFCEDSETFVVVTVYEPSLAIFESDLKTLRSVKLITR